MNTDDFAAYRPLLFSIAYRMTGSVGDAEDIVQEAFLRAARAARDKKGNVEAPKAYLATITTRLAIDHLKSARVRRETYLGTWLPEPIVQDGSDPAEHAELADSLSMAFLTLMESLTPPERAVFLLREVFGYDYPAVAQATGKSEAACRQLLARARQAIAGRRPRFSTSRADAEELASIFLDVSNGGDLASLLERLAPDVVFYGDSGGTGEVAFIDPVHGRDTVAAILVAQLDRVRRQNARLEPAIVNGMPGLLSYAVDGLIAAATFDVLDGQVQAIRVVANPDKLRHLGPVSASWHLRAAED
jgi:RNA polymerase sigma-70 factor (TIGR02957 family)